MGAAGSAMIQSEMSKGNHQRYEWIAKRTLFQNPSRRQRFSSFLPFLAHSSHRTPRLWLPIRVNHPQSILFKALKTPPNAKRHQRNSKTECCALLSARRFNGRLTMQINSSLAAMISDSMRFDHRYVLKPQKSPFFHRVSKKSIF